MQSLEMLLKMLNLPSLSLEIETRIVPVPYLLPPVLDGARRTDLDYY
jgi:hypothetical protein